MATFPFGYPVHSADPQRANMWVRVTVGSGPTFTTNRADCTFTDETGTGKYALRVPAAAKAMFCNSQVTKRGGTSVLTQQCVGNAIPVTSTGVIGIDVYGLTVATGALALADLVDGDVVDFWVSAQVKG